MSDRSTHPLRQATLGLAAPAIDLSRFVEWQEYPEPRDVVIAGQGGRRAGQQGRAIGCIGLKRSPGYDVLVEFPDGKIESFSPMSIFPAPRAQVLPEDDSAPGVVP